MHEWIKAEKTTHDGISNESWGAVQNGRGIYGAIAGVLSFERDREGERAATESRVESLTTQEPQDLLTWLHPQRNSTCDSTHRLLPIAFSRGSGKRAR